MNPKNIQVIFHRDHDGVAAAYCAWRVFGHAAAYHSVQYGEPFPEIPDGSRVFILDFSWPEKSYGPSGLAVLIGEFAGRCKELVIIDHHAGHVEQALGILEGWYDGSPGDRFDYRFDKTKSGVELSYEFFRQYSAEFAATTPARIPLALRLIGDRDLWRHENDPTYHPIDKANCQALHEGLFLIPHKWGTDEWFQAFHDIVLGSEANEPDDVEPWLEVIREGMVALRVRQAAVESICKNAYFAQYRHIETEHLWLPTVDSPVWQSEIAHHLLRIYPAYEAAVVRYRKPGAEKWRTKTVHSIRSLKDSDLALAIAQANGGGGHPSAAGFTTEEQP